MFSSVNNWLRNWASTSSRSAAADGESPRGVECLHFRQKLLSGGDLLVDFGARAGGQQGIVPMETGLGGRGRVETEHQLVENTVGQLVEIAVAGLRQAHAGYEEGEEDTKDSHFHNCVTLAVPAHHPRGRMASRGRVALGVQMPPWDRLRHWRCPECAGIQGENTTSRVKSCHIPQRTKLLRNNSARVASGMHLRTWTAMTSHIFTGAVLSIVLTATVGAQTAPAGKTAVLQVQNAILTTREGHQAFSALESKFAARKAELEKKQNDIAALQEQFRKSSATMSEEAQRKIARDIDKRTKALNYEAETTQTDYEQEQADTVQALERKFRVVVDKYARDNEFGVVLDVTDPRTPTFWWTNALDITNDVVRAYDAAYPTAAAPAAPAGKPKM